MINATTFRTLAAAVLSTLGLAVATAPSAHAATSCPYANYSLWTPAPANSHDVGGAAWWDDTVICQINEERSRAGARTLAYDPGPQNTANSLSKSCELYRSGCSLSYVNKRCYVYPSVIAPIDAFGRLYGDVASGAYWEVLRSPGHTKVGVGFYPTARGNLTYAVCVE